MARKKSGGDVGNGGTRKRHVSREEIVKAARLLSRQAGELDALVAVMAEQDIESVEIDGYGLLTRGLDELDRFISNVETGVNRVRRDRERFTA